MKILFITDNFPPEVNAPASRTFEHAKRWVASGIDVTVVTCAPNFPKGVVHAGYKNRWRSVEYVDGIRVVRVKSYITGNVGFSRRILDYVSFMLSAFVFGAFEKRPDVVVGTSPQFFAALGAWLLSVLKWRPFVFELRDLWPASIVTVGVMEKGLAIRMLEKLELFLYRRADAIVSVTDSFRENLAGRGIDRGKIHVVRNGVDLERYQPQPVAADTKREMGVEGKFVVAYLGTHGMAHALENVVDAAVLLQDRQDIAFLLVGDGADKSQVVERARELGLENLVFRDSVPKEQMPKLWSICDISLAHLKNDPVFATVIPSKIFESFGMGRPVMIVQPRGEAVDIVESHRAGAWVPPDNPEALAEAVKRWADSPELVGEFSRAASEAASHHSRDRLATEMLKIIQGLR